ncbi:MAG: hypothetical protein V1861_02740 [Candidatus Micrarchaeota archaeon]
MKMAILCILALSAIAPLAFAASDCEHTCCDKFNGSWDVVKHLRMFHDYQEAAAS